jgi:serine/threonine protein kinase
MTTDITVIAGGVATVEIKGNRVSKYYTIDPNDPYDWERINLFACELVILNLLSDQDGFPKLLDVDINIDQDRYGYVMPYLGRCWSEVKYLTQSDGFDVSNLLNHLGQICRLVSIMHNRNIVHMDLKPLNILIDAQDRVSIIDFSHSVIAAHYYDRLEANDLYAGGTYWFAPPEAHGGCNQCSSTSYDIWSLGCCLYYMLTGCSLFTGETMSEVRIAQQSDCWHAKIKLITNPLIRELLEWMLQLNASTRPTIDQIIARLDPEYLQTVPIGTRLPHGHTPDITRNYLIMYLELVKPIPTRLTRPCFC